MESLKQSPDKHFGQIVDELLTYHSEFLLVTHEGKVQQKPGQDGHRDDEVLDGRVLDEGRDHQVHGHEQRDDGEHQGNLTGKQAEQRQDCDDREDERNLTDGWS